MEREVREALKAAGLDELPPEARAWALERLKAFGASPNLHNIGGTPCRAQHAHKLDGCSYFAGEWMANHRTWGDGADALVALARRNQDTTEGFRSTHPLEGEVAGSPDVVAGLYLSDDQKKTLQWLDKQYNELNDAYMSMSSDRVAEFTSTKLRWTQTLMSWKSFYADALGAYIWAPDDADIDRWKDTYNYWLKNLDDWKKLKDDRKDVAVEPPPAAKPIPNSVSSPTPPQATPPAPVKAIAIWVGAGLLALAVASLLPRGR